MLWLARIATAQDDFGSPTACTRAPRDGSAAVEVVGWQPDAVDFCVTGQVRECFRVSPADGAVSRALPDEGPAAVSSRFVAYAGEREPAVAVCEGASCRSLPRAAAWAVASPGGGRVALGDREGGAEIELWDVASGRALWRVPRAPGAPACAWVQFLGDDRLLVAHVGCGAPLPHEPSEVYDARTGRLVARVPAERLRDAAVRVGPDAWALVDASAPTLVVLDVAAGTVARSQDLSAVAPGHAALSSWRDQLLVVSAGGAWARIDPDTGAVDVAGQVPPCP